MSTDLGAFDNIDRIAVGDPGTGSVNVSEPVTAVSLSATDADTNDVTALVDAIAPGDVLMLQTLNSPETWAAYTVTDYPINYGAWFLISVGIAAMSAVETPKAERVIVTLVPPEEQPVGSVDLGFGTNLQYPPTAKPPDATALAAWLSITSADATTQALLLTCCTVAAQYEFGRLSTVRMIEQGFNPPETIPGPVAQAMLMRAAAIYRRRNSVNGFEGFADLGALAIRASDPDIERLVDPWRAWAFA